MLSNLIIESTPGPSIKTCGEETGPQIKEYKTLTFSDVKKNSILMPKAAPSLVPSQRAEPLILSGTEAPGAVQEHSGVCRGAASLQAALRKRQAGPQ